MASKIVVNLDTRKDFNNVIRCKQNDDLPLEVNVFANGEPLNLTNKEIIINGTKPGKTYVKQNTGITKQDNTFNVDYLSRDFTRVPGTVYMEVVLLENEKQDTTFTFYLEVQASVLKGAVESPSTVTILEELDNIVVEAKQVKKETEQLVENGGAATKGDIQEVNTQLEQKAKQSDLLIERERITNLTKLDQGSTTGDAELIDGRVGADGKIYVNIGESIRTQLNNKTNEILKLESDFISGRKTKKQVLSLEDFKNIESNNKVTIYNNKINFSNISSSVRFLNGRNNFFTKGDILEFSFKFKVNSFSTTSELSRLSFEFNRYNGEVEFFGIDLQSNGRAYFTNGNSNVISCDISQIALNQEFEVLVKLDTEKAILEDLRIDVNLSNYSSFTDFSIDMFEVSTIILNQRDGEKLVVKYAKEAETITNLNDKISYLLRTKDIQEIKNMEDWHKLGFGLFIHWGVYSAMGGRYNGEDVTGTVINYDDVNSGVGSEWLLRTCRLPKQTYKAYESQFTGENWDTDLIAKLAYNAGMKYIVITSKHHEGFSLFPSENSEWDISNTPCRNTVLDELKQSCKKYGIKFGLYFSQNFDWTTKGGFGQEFTSTDGVTDPYTEEEHKAYVSKSVLLINELIDRYTPDVFWYDIPNEDDEMMRPFKDNELDKYPNIVVNDRLSNSYIGDYATGEGSYYHGDRKYAENCYTLNGSWGYSISKDTTTKTIPFATLIKRYILESLARGQNALINIGPKPNGSIPDLQKDLLSSVSNFSRKYGTFFNTKNVNKECQPNWGRMFAKDNVLKCYVYQGNSININGINTSFIDKVRVYDITDEYSINNYQIVSESVLRVNNIPTNSNKLSVVDVYFNNNIVSDDINYFSENDVISGLAFNFEGELLLDFSESEVSIGAWTGHESISTKFKFIGTTGNYKINYVESMRPDTNYTLTFKIVDIETEIEQVISINGNEVSSTSANTVMLDKDKTYKLIISKTGSWLNFVSCKFIN